MQPFSSSSSSEEVDSAVSSSAATTTTTATEVDVVEGGANDSVIDDSNDDDDTWPGFNPYEDIAEDDSSSDTTDFDSGDEEEDDEEDTEDEGFDESEQSSDNDREWNANQMQSLFMHLKATLKLDVCYNCTLGSTKITNFDICCEELHCDFEYGEILGFISSFMDIKFRVDKKGNPIILGDHKEDVIKGAFLRFFQEFVMCRECGHKMERAVDTYIYSIGAECPSCSFNKKIKLAHTVVE